MRNNTEALDSIEQLAIQILKEVSRFVPAILECPANRAGCGASGNSCRGSNCATALGGHGFLNLDFPKSAFGRSCIFSTGAEPRKSKVL